MLRINDNTKNVFFSHNTASSSTNSDNQNNLNFECRTADKNSSAFE